MQKSTYEIVRPEDVLDLKPSDDTRYVLNDDFLKPMEGVTETENTIATKYLRLMDLSLTDDAETLITLYPQELHSLLVFLQRESLKEIFTLKE